jgi:hypothetical protein
MWLGEVTIRHRQASSLLSFRDQYEPLLHPFFYVIDFKRALRFGEAQAGRGILRNHGRNNNSPATRGKYSFSRSANR